MVIINKSMNNICWQGCGEKGTLMHSYWEFRLVQPLWKAVRSYLKKLKMELLFDPAVPLLGIYSKTSNTLIQKNMMNPYVYSRVIRVIYNSQDMEASQDMGCQVPINR